VRVNARRVEITLSQERWEQLEAARGHEPRAAFIKRALEQALAIDALRPFEPEPPDQPPHAKGGRMKTFGESMMDRQRKLNEAKS
jgi:hypothetical protein